MDDRLSFLGWHVLRVGDNRGLPKTFNPFGCDTSSCRVGRRISGVAGTCRGDPTLEFVTSLKDCVQMDTVIILLRGR